MTIKDYAETWKAALKADKTEEQIVKAWQIIFDVMTIMGKSDERATVESAEFIEEVQE